MEFIGLGIFVIAFGPQKNRYSEDSLLAVILISLGILRLTGCGCSDFRT
jgi:hypothetical protein